MFEPEVAAAADGASSAAPSPATSTQRFDDLASDGPGVAGGVPLRGSTSARPEATTRNVSAADVAAHRRPPLGQAGLTAQAVSAARRLGAETVQRTRRRLRRSTINTLPGVGVRVRSELQRRRRAWRAPVRRPQRRRGAADAAAARGRGDPDRARAAGSQPRQPPPPPWLPGCSTSTSPTTRSTWPDLATAAAEAGLDGDPDHVRRACWPPTGRVTQAGKALLGDVTATLAALGGVATVDEIAERLVALRGSDAEGATRRRNAVGLVRAAVEADAGATLAILRHGDAGAPHDDRRRRPPTSDSRPPPHSPPPSTRPSRDVTAATRPQRGARPGPHPPADAETARDR